MAERGREKRTYFLKRGNRRCKRPTGLDGVSGAMQTGVHSCGTELGGGRILKSLVEAFGLHPKCKRFK